MSAANFTRLVELFGEECTRREAQLTAAVAPLDKHAIAIAAYRVRGFAANMGAAAPAECASSPEESAPTGSADDIARALAQLLDLAARSRCILAGLKAM
jgi:HPt (histidine-containing phosphotransfer) domain-containing protein